MRRWRATYLVHRQAKASGVLLFDSSGASLFCYEKRKKENKHKNGTS
jgi:hypothetical protein